jgi:hypothetical protein
VSIAGAEWSKVVAAEDLAAAMQGFNAVNPGAFGDLNYGERTVARCLLAEGRAGFVLAGLCSACIAVPHVGFAVNEAGRSLVAVVEAWCAIWRRFHDSTPGPAGTGSEVANLKQHTSALCLLLSNPLEIVELACEDGPMSKQLSELLGLDNLAAVAEHWTTLGFREDIPVLEAIKWLKAPSWRYRTEVQGLANIAAHKITNGGFNLNEVSGCVPVRVSEGSGAARVLGVSGEFTACTEQALEGKDMAAAATILSEVDTYIAGVTHASSTFLGRVQQTSSGG